MPAKIYTEEQIKTLVLTWCNKIKKLDMQFYMPDADESYDFAVRECGFALPAEGDPDHDINNKNHWLIRRMQRWFIERIRDANLLLIDTGDVEGGGVVSRLESILAKMDDEFMAAKESESIGHLFIGITTLKPRVVASGFNYDRAGQDRSYES